MTSEIKPSGEDTAAVNSAPANVIDLSERLKQRIDGKEPVLQAAVPGFNLEGRSPDSRANLAYELDLLADYMGMLADKMAGKVAMGQASAAEMGTAALLVRCHRKAQWIQKRVTKLERKAEKWKARAKEQT